MGRFLRWCLLVSAAAACAAQGVGSQAEVASVSASILTVVNDCFDDATVYVVHDGMKQRRLEGYVTGRSSREYTLTQGDVATGSLQLLVSFVGGRGRPVLSEPVMAVPGAHYTWQLDPGCGTESLSRWNQRA